MRGSLWLRDRPLPTGFGLPLGFGAGIVVTMIAVAAGATRQPGWLVLALAVVVAAVSAISRVGAALGTVVTSWCLLDGFVLGRHGQLVFTAEAARAGAVLALVAGAGLVTGMVARAVRSRSLHERAAIRDRSFRLSR